VSDRSASANDGEVFPAMLDGVEQICEVAGGVGSTDLRHEIILSDLEARPSHPGQR
jgi:hypothetical protein